MNTPPESPAPAPPKAGKNAAVHAPVSTTGEAEKKKAKKKKRQKKIKVGGAAGAAAAAVSEHSGAKPTKGGALHDAQAQSYVDMHFVCKTVYATVCTFAWASGWALLEVPYVVFVLFVFIFVFIFDVEV